MVYSREEVLRKFKICLIIGVILAVFMGAVNIILPIMAGEFTFEVIILFVGILISGVVIFPIEFLGFWLGRNFMKAMIGCILPIPILSCCIECFKAVWYGIKGVMAIFQGKETVVIGKAPVTSDEE